MINKRNKTRPTRKPLAKTLSANNEIDNLYARIALVIHKARATVMRSIDTTMVKAYWLIGSYIVEQEQQGAKRAAYGKELLKTLSVRLNKEFGRGFGMTTLEDIRKFYLVYAGGQIPHAVRGELESPKFNPNLSWTHCEQELEAELKRELKQLKSVLE